MIYLDNSATTVQKPNEVAEAVKEAINTFGNHGRSFHDASTLANRAIYNAREQIATLAKVKDPLSVAFTANATESLNLVISSLIEPTHAVLTTETEHNSVLRPLFLSGCKIVYAKTNDTGCVDIDSIRKHLSSGKIDYMLCNHGSNLTGNIIDLSAVYELCKEYDTLLIVDASQTFGSITVTQSMADIICFTGHKGLFGPQGTGGIIASKRFDFKIVKSGGSGTDSFAKFQSTAMPDIFEVGTLNSHSLHGLAKGVEFINNIGIDKIQKRCNKLAEQLYDGIKNIENIALFGDYTANERLAVISFAIKYPETKRAGEETTGKTASTITTTDKKITRTTATSTNISRIISTGSPIDDASYIFVPSSDISYALWDKYRIASRSGIHCVPLLHKRFLTDIVGLVRLSLSYFNTDKEIKTTVEAIKEIASQY